MWVNLSPVDIVQFRNGIPQRGATFINGSNLRENPAPDKRY
jgi:hypothetical protein